MRLPAFVDRLAANGRAAGGDIVAPDDAAARRLRRRMDLFIITATGAMVGVGQALGLLPYPIDAGAYYTQAPLDALYGAAWNATGYVYPPPMAQLLAPLHVLGWPVFIVFWTTLIWAALGWMLGRWTWLAVAGGVVAIMVPGTFAFGVVLGYALNGNIQILLAAGIVLALRRPGWWALGALTKFGTGIGVLYPLFRRDWRAVAEAGGVTLVIVAVSFALAPSLWFDWGRYMLASVEVVSTLPMVPVPFPVRLVMSVALLAYAARTGREWLVAIAAGWAIPALYDWTFIAIWIAAVPLVRQGAGARRERSLVRSAHAAEAALNHVA